MNLDDRLRRLAHHIDNELDATMADTADAAEASVTLTRRTRRGSRPLLASIAAAAVITVGGGGLAVTSWTSDSTPAAGTSTASSAPQADNTTTPPIEPTAGAERQPSLPTVYPAVDEQIDGATEAQGSYSMIGYDNPLRVDALIGIASDTTLTGGIQVQAVAGDRADAEAQFIPPDTVGPTPTVTTVVTSTSGSGSALVEPMSPSRETVQVWGREADLYTEPGTPQIQTVVIDVGLPSVAVTLRFTGLDPLAVLEGADEFVQVVPVPPVDDSGSAPFTLKFGSTLPAGYHVVVEPTAAPNSAVVGSLSVNNTASVEGNLIQVSTYNPLTAFAAAGSFTAVDVNGTPGWMSDGPGHAVIWPVNDATYALVGGSATTDEAVTVANTVTFIDEATWRARYNVPEPDFGTAPTSQPPQPNRAPQNRASSSRPRPSRSQSPQPPSRDVNDTCPRSRTAAHPYNLDNRRAR